MNAYNAKVLKYKCFRFLLLTMCLLFINSSVRATVLQSTKVHSLNSLSLNSSKGNILDNRAKKLALKNKRAQLTQSIYWSGVHGVVGIASSLSFTMLYSDDSKKIDDENIETYTESTPMNEYTKNVRVKRRRHFTTLLEYNTRKKTILDVISFVGTIFGVTKLFNIGSDWMKIKEIDEEIADLD